MQLLRAVSFLLTFTMLGSLSAKEYENLIQYKAKTGKDEITRKDWVKQDRKNNTSQWQQACLYNFSYQGGAKEYTTMEERQAFYFWVSEYLAKKGHEIKWPEATAELTRYIKKTQKATFDNDIKLLLAAVHKVVFDTAFSKLQQVKNMQQPLRAMAADTWDKEMFFFEHTEIYQPLISKMDAESTEKLNNIMDRKGLAAFSLPIELKMKGEVQNVNDRISWAEYRLLAFIEGNAMTPREIKNNERVAKKEKKLNKKKAKSSKSEKQKPVIVNESE